MRPKLSIVIPTLNEELYLPLLLEDLSQQTEKDFDVVVIDAKSEDNTKKAAQKFDKKLHLQFIESSRRRVAYQRNLGAKNAKGTHIFFVDADSRLEKDVVEKITNRIAREKGRLYLPVVKPSPTSGFNRFMFSLSIRAVLFMHFIGKPLAFGPLLIIEKKLFDEIGGYEEDIKMGEDHNIILKAHRAGAKAKFIRDITCVFSLRRFDVDSRWEVFIQYMKSIFITLVKGGAHKVEEDYEMGGQRYGKATKR
jgi:glycosyltransferase involved in cell wall biosynthesis